MRRLRIVLVLVMWGAGVVAQTSGCGGGQSPAAAPVARSGSATAPATRATSTPDWGILKVVRTRFPSVRQMSPEELAAWQADGSKVQPVLLDVRKREEYDVSHLPGAIHVDPGASGKEVAAQLAARGVTADRPIVLYCSVGYRSSACATKLSEVGYGDVANLEGSIFRWANEGRPVVRRVDGKEEVVREVHPYDSSWGRLLNADLHPARATGKP